MKLLVIGNGGREHALVWKLSQSPLVTQIFVAPGNPGTATELKTQNVDIAVNALEELCEFALENQIDLTIPGSETPLAQGIVDLFSQRGLKCFGPSQQAAKLEASKVFAKDFLKKYHIPTPNAHTFTSFSAALAHAQKQTYPLVLKADGLAGGKGVIVAHRPAEAIEWLASVFKEERFGVAGKHVLFEEFIAGEELSFIVLTDGEYFIPLPISQDHKTRDNQDVGPNTGGMGAYSPTQLLTTDLKQKIIKKIINPTLKGLQQEGIPYQGFLYAGLMIDATGEPKVLEFNCRLGDPEAQVVMMRCESDLLPLLLACVNRQLAGTSLEVSLDTALTVVMCMQGYPDQYIIGQPIQGLNHIAAPLKVFHAGTKIEGEQLVTAGGRVLNISVRAANLATAQRLVYAATPKITWSHCYYRTDIGFKEMIRIQSKLC